ncbi:Meckel syndrome type 1 protein [Trichoplax sp. H2]|uniref:Meckel syndrome type 1 protein n=1 Tax=Trichoplax adhaerens TaxID=10228 RepID=B3SAM9_TRIAD|nr:hypothetical protein TRIADDRAFT_61316 [Trichoplax adhaerens]EDV20131.1 hypothetical protein TRIADDRAFT_61316 [Trichoplax adhaerens]RDD38076.1 Meckel syndrome type 1 protein [Trichoplax sp. H2]|eukprot:XP_002117292.1 hypothetical protein TRIADDRAFT_61316 [Trichoplax adhaerens]
MENLQRNIASYYRSKDPIRNLKIRVTLKKVTAASVVPTFAHENKKPSDQIEMQTIKKEDEKTENKAEECVIGWQEKLYCKRETDYYADSENCNSVLDHLYHKEVLSVRNSRTNKRLFSYVDHDNFADDENNDDDETIYVTPVAKRISNLRRRRLANKSMGDRADKDGNKVALQFKNPISDDSSRTLSKLIVPEQSMFIMADLSNDDREPTKEDEYVLCSVTINSNGLISIKPDFNTSNSSYRIVTKSEYQEVYEYRLEHCSKPMSKVEEDREKKALKELYQRHGAYQASLIGTEFATPPPSGTLRVNIFGEINMAKNFEYNDIYIHYCLYLTTEWKTRDSDVIAGFTQISKCKGDKEKTAHFGHPFEFEITYEKANFNQVGVSEWPQLFIEVVSCDSWQRYRIEGYGYTLIPQAPGMHKIEIQTWRPVAPDLVSEMRRFFIGGAPELNDITYVSHPAGSDGPCLSKYGLKTASSGSVTVKMNVLQQSQFFVDKTKSRKKVGTLLDKLGGEETQAALAKVIDAFQKARNRLKAARGELDGIY